MTYSPEALAGVVQYYLAEKLQPENCPYCKYLAAVPYDEDVPEGYEKFRGGRGYICQCPEHDKPRRPWLASPLALEWLAAEAARHEGPFRPDFEAWEKAACS